LGRAVASYAALGLAVAGLSFASPALAAEPLEPPETNAATAVTGTSATLHGTLNPNNENTAGYYFAYDTGGTCEFGPITAVEPEQEGKAIPISASVTGLEAKTEYFFCAAATNGSESLLGAPLSFTTSSSAPVIESSAMSRNTPFSVLLGGVVNPENEPTSCVFEYGETALTGIGICEQGTFEGGGPVEVSVNIGEFNGAPLTPGTTYHYRLVAENATGKTEGTEGTFETKPLEAPIVESPGATNVTSESAKLEETVNPNYQETTYAFEYATTEEELKEGKGTVVPGAEALPPEFTERRVSTTIRGLKPRTSYFFRVVATNASGTSKQEAGFPSFKTQGKPILTTGPAEGITRTTAIVSGIVNPGNAQTSAHIAYIDQEDFEVAESKGEDPFEAEGSRQTSNVNITTEEGFSAHGTGPIELRELKAGTTYDYEIVATNSAGTETGQVATFTTSAATPPIATTGEAVGVTQTAATLTGTVDTRGLRTTMSFEMGETTRLGLPELASVVPGSESGTSVGIELSFGNYLPPGTTFYYRACATNADGTNCGAVKTFTTASFPMPPAYSVPSLPVLPVQSVTPPGGKTSGGGSGSKGHRKKRSGSSKKLAKALKACAKKPKSKRAACQRQARKKYGKKG
jgi:hypothetical protein